MSIFDPTSGMSSLEWLQEKSLLALETAVKLTDLANEEDTASWYRKNLRGIAESLIARLIPMTGLLHQTGAEAVIPEEWEGIVEGGTFALAKWCRKWGVANPYRFSSSAIAKERNGEEVLEKSQVIESEIEYDSDGNSSQLKLEIYSRFSLKMLHDEFSSPETKLLSWALFHLNASEYADIVILEKEFLPTDIGCTTEDTAEAYRRLYGKGYIEKVEGLDIREKALAVRLVVDGLNDSKHPVLYKEEALGMPGLRIDGKPTIGNVFYITYDGITNRYLGWLAQSEEKMKSLQSYLQESVGRKVAHIERVNVVTGEATGSTEGETGLSVQLRYPIESDDQALEDLLSACAKRWLSRSRVAG